MFVEDRGPIRVLTLSNPTRGNALDEELLEELASAITRRQTSHVRAFLLRSKGARAFCSGYDLSRLAPPKGGPLPDQRLSQLMRELASHPAASVALINGGAFGAGCELAISCDFRVGGPKAVFCMPPARLGVIYAPDGLWRLAQLCGLSTAKLMFLTGRVISGQQAQQRGLLDERHGSSKAAERAAFALCEELAANAPLAVSGMKRTFELLSEAPLGAQERKELEALRRAAFNSQDVREGRAAFLEKRKPVFRGR